MASRSPRNSPLQTPGQPPRTSTGSSICRLGAVSSPSIWTGSLITGRARGCATSWGSCWPWWWPRQRAPDTTRWLRRPSGAADAPGWVLIALGAKPDPLTGAITTLSEATLRGVLAGVDAADLQRLTAAWVQAVTRTCAVTTVPAPAPADRPYRPVRGRTTSRRGAGRTPGPPSRRPVRRSPPRTRSCRDRRERGSPTGGEHTALPDDEGNRHVDGSGCALPPDAPVSRRTYLDGRRVGD